MKFSAFKNKVLFLLALGALGGAGLSAEEKGPKRGDAILPIDFSKETDRAKWNLGDFAAWVPEGKKGNTVLKVVVGADKTPGHQKAGATLDLSPYKGMKLLFECEVKAKDVSKPPQTYNGVKFMIHLNSASTGEKWINENNVYGTFEWKTVTAILNVPSDVISADYNLGLENSTGTVWFESPRVTVLNAQLPVRPKPAANAPPAFTGHEGIPRLRGVMSPNTFKEEDFKTLAEWNVNLVRWQINRNWGASGTETDLDKYDKWIDSKMAELDAALKTAQVHGIKLVIDLHTPPGGRLKDMSMRMFYEKKYQDHFVKVWETFAKRYKGNPAVWAYDLVNEPVENTPAAPGQSFWETQVRAAKAIRAIDSQTPIVIESEAFDSPEAYATLMPVDVPR
ncbi:MAG: cellulase family glycosylhydrolase, partial [Spirochaetia bacterium]|nr:cellulase family glycosylhydrolase [Spirochaetia bacterium]